MANSVSTLIDYLLHTLQCQAMHFISQTGVLLTSCVSTAAQGKDSKLLPALNKLDVPPYSTVDI